MALLDHDTREGWLRSAAGLLHPMFTGLGLAYPQRLRMSVSMTPKKVRGYCFAPEASADGSTELLIRISEDDPIEVLGVLVHELVHASVGVKEGHKGAFVPAVRALGLEGKVTATVPGARFRASMVPIVHRLGPFPHAALDYSGSRTGPKKQVSRQLKAMCERCGYIVRVSRKWLDDVGAPHCPDHGAMTVDAAEEDEGE